ncbi:mitoferrin-like [Abrus precatorius]|uniref:Mitoferrin-like n=1 Tax=Abrus precatorius TaxID=3816 RepID=A0A8B8L845_ABRPR|nr:mitoferrin-like [Abrus precatorius]
MATNTPPNFHTISTELHKELSLPSSPTHHNLHFCQYMIAGSIAGFVEHTAMFPIDTLKTRMQALNGPSSVHSLGLRKTLSSIIKLEGPKRLYRGITAMGLGAGPAHAVYFSVYEVCKETLEKMNINMNKKNNSVVHAFSGVCATVASDAVFTPMDVVKQRLQLKCSPYKGVMDCVKRVVVEEGVGAFFASYRTTVVMNAPFTAVHFATYEAAKKGLVEVSAESVDDERWIVHATAGAAAGALAAAVTTPLDVVKTQLQCQGVCGCDKFSSSSIGHVIQSVIRKDGYRGLMRGYIPRMLFHAPAAAICWSTYEASKSFFQQRNDSSSVHKIQKQ